MWGPRYKRIWALSAPIMVGMLAENIINITDTVMVGRLGTSSLGAVGLGTLYYFTLVLIAIGLSNGLQIIVGRRQGEGSPLESGQVLDNSLVVFLGLGILCGIILLFSTNALLPHLIKNEEVATLASQYLRFRVWGIVSIFILCACRGFFIGVERTSAIIFIIVGEALLNTFLNYVLIFGKLGFPAYGVKGSGMATAIAETAGALAYLGLLKWWPAMKPFHALRFKGLSWVNMGNLLKVGSPLMLQSLISIISWVLLFLLIEKMGQNELAASIVVRNIYVLLLIPTWGFSVAASTLVSHTIGEGKPNEVPKRIKEVLRLALGVMAVFAGAVFLFRDAIMRIYTSNEVLIEMAQVPLAIVCVAVSIYAASYVFFSAVSGTGATRVALYIEFGTIVIYILYMLASVLWWHWSLSAVWTCEIVYMALLGIASLQFLRKGNWSGKLV